MKNLITGLILLVFSSLAIGQTINLESFDKLDASSSYHITLIKSDQSKAEVEMIKGDFDDVIVKVKGNTLKIKTKKYKSKKTKANINVYYKELNEIEASAGVRVNTNEKLEAEYLSLDVSSGASVDIDIKVDKLNADASSGCHVKIKGSADKQNVDVSSGASYSAGHLESKYANAEASSGSSIKIWCTKSLKAEASSGGSIIYLGDPNDTDLDVSKWSGGSITAK